MPYKISSWKPGALTLCPSQLVIAQWQQILVTTSEELTGAVNYGAGSNLSEILHKLVKTAQPHYAVNLEIAVLHTITLSELCSSCSLSDRIPAGVGLSTAQPGMKHLQLPSLQSSWALCAVVTGSLHHC